MRETYYDLTGTFEIEVTPENIERIQALDEKLKECGWHGEDEEYEYERESDAGAAIRIGDKYVYAEITDRNDFEDIEATLLGIPGVHDSTLIREFYWSPEAWDAELFTAWADIAGPFEVWLQVLNSSGQFDLWANVTPHGITVKEEFQPMRGVMFSIEGPFAVEVTAENIERIRAFESRVRGEYKETFHPAADVQDIKIGDTYRIASEDRRDSGGWTDDHLPYPICNYPDVVDFFEEHDPDHCLQRDDERWEQSIFDEWEAIAGPISIFIECSSLDGSIEDGQFLPIR